MSTVSQVSVFFIVVVLPDSGLGGWDDECFLRLTRGSVAGLMPSPAASCPHGVCALSSCSEMNRGVILRSCSGPRRTHAVGLEHTEENIGLEMWEETHLLTSQVLQAGLWFNKL